MRASRHYPTEPRHGFLFALGAGLYRRWDAATDGSLDAARASRPVQTDRAPRRLRQPLAVLVAALVGTTFGIVAGYFGGRSDMIIMRVVDVQLAFPPLLLTIIIAGILGPSIWNVVFSLAVICWAIFARLVRGITLSIREKEYVEGARALGVRSVGVMARHILPNTLNAIVIIATLQIALQMLAEGALSFLGMGVPPPTPSWGGLISHGRDYLDTAWWMSTIPGVAMTAVLLIIGMFGDALRDRLDPRFHG